MTNQSEENKKDANQNKDVNPKSTKQKIWDAIKEFSFLIFILATFIFSSINQCISENEKDIDIVASLLTKDSANWQLKGRVIKDGDPLAGARVWAILKDKEGNRSSPPAVTSDSQGEFTIDSLAQYKNDLSLSEIALYSKASVPAISDGDTTHTIIHGEQIISMQGESSFRIVSIPVWTIIFLPAIFLVSILIPFTNFSHKLKYGYNMLLAFLFTVAMIITISSGLKYVNTTSNSDEIVSLGFANIFKGTYVKGQAGQNEWLFSLTSLHEINRQLSTAEVNDGTADDRARVVKGFGVPLWVLLLSVLGTSLITFSVIVLEIKDRPKFNVLAANNDESENNPELEKFRTKLENIVRHQFYVLFSPLGSIFIYQMLVAVDAANQPVTVAFAALGAGVSLNLILKKAIDTAAKTLNQTTGE